jgi:intein/homing endonuclease
MVPDWIYHGPDSLKRTFLSIIYGNEGSKPSNNKWRIQFVLSKAKEFVPDLLLFLNQIRAMLNHFDISTSNIQLRKQKERAFCGRFYIKGKENLIRFYQKIGFLYASEKQKVLESLILKGKS